MATVRDRFQESFEDIEEAFTYVPYFDDPQKLVDDLIRQVSTYIPADQATTSIQKAYDIALQAHGEQKRLSGESYIIHPLKVTEILLLLHPDLATIQASILHDVIEDTSVTFDEIKQTFGSEVALLCEWLSKVSVVKYRDTDERQLETLKKTFLAMAKDLRVIFLKLADRIHNIQTLYFHPKPEKRKRIALETMKIYVPIAKKMWLFKYAVYLENGAFKELEPEAYRHILDFFKKRYRNTTAYTKEGIRSLMALLETEHVVDFDIKARLKSPYRIWEKMEGKYHTDDFSRVLDILAFRIITKSVSDCYTTLWLIHGQWRPIISKIKDYIAIPKFNNYQSLHTTVLGMFPFPTEIQIRTREMDEVAEFGIAAHFAYSEHKWSTCISQKQSKWIKELQDTVAAYANFDSQEKKDDFKESLNIEFLTKNTFVYTPKWDVIELPENSTILDFAFRIHTDVGLRFKNAIVNNIIKPISFIPKTGDIIHINTFRNKYPATKYWLDFLHTPTAKAKLTRFLKQKNKDEYIAIAVDLINEKLKSLNLPLLYADKDLIAKNLDDEDLEKNLLRIADKQDSPISLIKLYYPTEVKTYQKNKKPEVESKSERFFSDKKPVVIIDIDKKISSILCPFCQPSIENKIIAKTGKEGIKIHTLACKALKTVSFDRLLEAHRLGDKNTIYDITLLLEIQHTSNSLMSLMAVFTDLNINIENISVEKKDNSLFHVKIQSSYTNPTKCGMIINELQKNSSFITILDKYVE